MTDVYFTWSTDGISFLPNVRVSTASSNEHDCGGSTIAHFRHRNRRKCMKNLVVRDGIEPPPAFSGLSGDTRDATVG